MVELARDFPPLAMLAGWACCICRYDQLLLEHGHLGIFFEEFVDLHFEQGGILQLALHDHEVGLGLIELRGEVVFLFTRFGDVAEEQIGFGILDVALRPARFFGDVEELVHLAFDVDVQVFEIAVQQIVVGQAALSFLFNNFVLVCLGDGIDEPHQIFGQFIAGEGDAENFAVLRKVHDQVILQPLHRIRLASQRTEAGDARGTNRGGEHEITFQQGELSLLQDFETCLILPIGIEEDRVSARSKLGTERLPTTTRETRTRARWRRHWPRPGPCTAASSQRRRKAWRKVLASMPPRSTCWAAGAGPMGIVR